MKKKLITISGPTASGKTELSITLALNLNCSIISSDSRQFYKEMTIGTAVPSKYELSKVKHYCIQHKSINDNYTIKDFQIEALNIIKNELKINNNIIMVGGSGMYMDALIYGLDSFPEIIPEIRAEISSQYKDLGIKYLQNKLKNLDPEYFLKVDIHNHRRLIRALEVSLSSNKPYSSFLNNRKVNHDFKIINTAINCDRDILYERINDRVDEMLHRGLLNEVKSLVKFKNLRSMNTVGYKELFHYLENKTSFDDAVIEIKKNSRRFAKKQMTWLRNKKDIKWIKNNIEIDDFMNLINSNSLKH
ncbi:tRNA (adenosine(37)-N6)-dimethylallyltransferase MiaA [Flavobacteriaceae bacterium]|nr:tRNA (adenosine(37)-N6)-dimethylallyltransferase MiaA [Flavobacteriaceae bacterium]MDC1337494.1 tRNA (adenosine(37)-N6)-dimethylallyltransferase MiaA [Flavobacteriaceae bacterium]